MNEKTLPKFLKQSNWKVTFLVWSALWLITLGSTAQAAGTPSEEFLQLARAIPAKAIENLPLQSNGRMKPFDTFARESLLYMTGKYKWWGLTSVQTYLALVTQDSAKDLEIIEVRNPDLRVTLGFQKDKRYFSVSQLETSALEAKVRALLPREEQNDRTLTPEEKNLLEVSHQFNLARAVLSGQHFLMGLEFLAGSSSGHEHGSPHGTSMGTSMGISSEDSGAGRTRQTATRFLQAVASKDPAQSVYARDLVLQAKTVPVTELLRSYREKADLEVLYNKVDPFFVAGLLYLLLGLLLLFPVTRESMTGKGFFGVFLLPVLIHGLGFAARVYITGFAPVTNMYGTMVWVAFGVALFSLALYKIYRHLVSTGLLVTAAGLILMLTHNMPLILSPDMDPVVAVLRSNFWLTIHVLTITISYAAFTAAMLLGNAALIRAVIKPNDRNFFAKYGHLAYRMIQLGVFLLSAGIILGGVWADYSWGRFWGWDPKETWALIADLGFLMILHARYVGWVREFGLLASSTVGYLLVIMAWYGVNFILATGKHSYGFSSGGVVFVTVFVSLQVLLLAVALGLRSRRVSSLS
jgi:ABC-type transport system involved in cytochrome c biogenesis permease subunit